MVYKWEPHRQTCYRLYVEENMPMHEVIEYMREHHNFTPRFVFAFSRLPHRILSRTRHTPSITPSRSALP